MFGTMNLEINSKFEYRNPEQIQFTEIPMTETYGYGFHGCVVCSIGALEFRICFSFVTSIIL